MAVSGRDIVASTKLKHYFNMLEQSGTTLVDIKSGAVWNVSAGLKTLTFDAVRRAIKTSILAADNPIALASGTWARLRPDQQLLIVAAGYHDTAVGESARIAFGDNNNLLAYTLPAGWGLAGSPMHTSIGATSNSTGEGYQEKRIRATGPDNGTNMVELVYDDVYIDDALNGSDCLWTGSYTGDENSHFYLQDLDTGIKVRETNYTKAELANQCVPDGSGHFYYVPALGPYPNAFPKVWDKNPVTGVADVDYMQPNPCMRFSGVSAYAIAVFIYDAGLPSGWDEAALRTARKWRDGYRYIDPVLL